ncbi:MAG TPA: hypothetical protein VGR92_01070 [Steroidobacteraceae bacterium]|nr:hypothetical protein [Steroidobacteraceae bacterium]
MRSSLFQRTVLPGLAFKAIVIGGGYATGRELAEYFIPGGPWGGLAGMALTMAVWSVVCVVTFLFAQTVNAPDYGTFFRSLLGPLSPALEIAYVIILTIVLSAYGAAAGAIGAALFGWPLLAGTLGLITFIALIAAFGNASVERLFKWASIALYATYAIFLVLTIGKFGGRIADSFATTSLPAVRDWTLGGLTYAGYNVFGAAVILSVVSRHVPTTRDAITAGLLSGPLAIIPGILFFICMCAYYPQIGAQTLPSDFLLLRLGLPALRFVFQLMIFLALLESGTGMIHAINERIAASWRTRRGTELGKGRRFATAAAFLVGSIFIAERLGLVSLIAKGYRVLAALVLVIYVLPLMTYGLWRIVRASAITGTRVAR